MYLISTSMGINWCRMQVCTHWSLWWKWGNGVVLYIGVTFLSWPFHMQHCYVKDKVLFSVHTFCVLWGMKVAVLSRDIMLFSHFSPEIVFSKKLPLENRPIALSLLFEAVYKLLMINILELLLWSTCLLYYCRHMHIIIMLLNHYTFIVVPWFLSGFTSAG